MDIKLSDGRTVEVDDGVAPEDVESFLKSNNLTRAEEAPTGNPVWSGVKAAATGVGKAIPDVIDAVRLGGHYLNKGIDYLENKAGIGQPSGKGQEFDPNLVNKTVGKAIGGWHEPTGLTEKVLEGAGEASVGGLAGPGGWLSKLFLYGALPGAASELASAGVQATPLANVPGADLAARTVASVFSPMGARKIITPNTITDPVRQAANATLAREMPGVQTAGQATGNPKLMARELSAAPGTNERQARQFTRAATRIAGNETPTVTTGPGGTVARGMNQASQAIDNVANQTSIPFNQQTAAPLIAWQNARQNAPHLQRVGNIISDTLGRNTPFRNGAMSGQEYQHLRSRLHSHASTSSDPLEAHALRQYAGALDNAMDIANPNAANTWRQARQSWENNSIIKDAAAKAKKGSTQLTPEQLEQSAKSFIGKDRFVLGGQNPPPGSPRSDYTELTRAAQSGLPKLKPGEQTKVEGNIAALLGYGGGVALGHYMGLPLHTAAETAVGPLLAGYHAGNLGAVRRALKPAADAWTMSRPGQAYYRNQATPLLPQQRGQRMNAQIVRALMQSQRAQ